MFDAGLGRRGFHASTPGGGDSREGAYADSLLPGEKKPAGVGSYILYSLAGVPRDVAALVLEPAGFAFGAVGGVVLNVVSIPFQVLFEGDFKTSRPVARGCVMAAGFPFFIVSDFISRSFTGDRNRYRWGVHPFPRVDHRWFPNYHAIFGTKED